LFYSKLETHDSLNLVVETSYSSHIDPYCVGIYVHTQVLETVQ